MSPFFHTVEKPVNGKQHVVTFSVLTSFTSWLLVDDSCENLGMKSFVNGDGDHCQTSFSGKKNLDSLTIGKRTSTFD